MHSLSRSLLNAGLIRKTTRKRDELCVCIIFMIAQKKTRAWFLLSFLFVQRDRRDFMISARINGRNNNNKWCFRFARDPHARKQCDTHKIPPARHHLMTFERRCATTKAMKPLFLAARLDCGDRSSFDFKTRRVDRCRRQRIWASSS